MLDVQETPTPVAPFLCHSTDTAPIYACVITSKTNVRHGRDGYVLVLIRQIAKED